MSDVFNRCVAVFEQVTRHFQATLLNEMRVGILLHRQSTLQRACALPGYFANLVDAQPAIAGIGSDYLLK